MRRGAWILLGSALLAACDGGTVLTPPNEPRFPPGPPIPVGVYEITMTGIGAGEMSSTIRPVRPGLDASAALTPITGSLVFEQTSSLSFTEGTRTAGGQRFVSFSYRVYNGSGAPRSNVTLIMVERAGNIGGTPVSLLRRFDGTTADSLIARRVVPTGSVAPSPSQADVVPLLADVMQAFTEQELDSIALPAGVTGVFPYGYVVRSALTSANRALPIPADANRFDGLLTVAFRLPLQASSAQDVFSITFQVMAVEDSRTRVTESIEEQSLAGQAGVSAASAALGATMVTVLDGSTSVGYAGQRQICGLRTSGLNEAFPTTIITSPGAYTRIGLYRRGENRAACNPGFVFGLTQDLGVLVPDTVRAYPMDRYGNTLSAITDTIALTSTDAGFVAPAPGVTASGNPASLVGRFSDYGSYTITARGRRLRSQRAVQVVPIVRTWHGSLSTDWSLGANWDTDSPPASQDAVQITTAVFGPYAPALTANDTVGSVLVYDFRSLYLGSYDLTVNGIVYSAEVSGGIRGTGGKVILNSPVASSVCGRIARVRVVGHYSALCRLTLSIPAELAGGTLLSAGYPILITPWDAAGG